MRGGGGGFLVPHRKPTSALNSLTKFAMCIGFCMNITTGLFEGV